MVKFLIQKGLQS